MSQTVKPGYKQTEVGVIPEEWELTPLVELIDASRSIRYGIVQPGKFDPSGRYMVRGQDYSTGWVDPSQLFRVSPQVEEPFKNARVKAGDVIITIVGASTGHIEVIPDWLDGANLTQTTARLAINPEKAFSAFCKCYLQSAAGQRQVANYLKGAAQPGLNCGDIEKFRIPLPTSLPEQRAIATALSDVDALLAALDRLIAKQRDLKQAAMQQLLTGQTRLPGFTGKWETKRLGDVGAFLKGSGVKKDESQSGPLPCIRYGEIYTRHNDYIKEFHSFISTQVAATACLLKMGDLLFAGSGETKEEIGKCVAFVDDFEAYAGGDIVILRPHGVDSLFLGYSLNTPSINRQKASRGQGDAVVHIGSSALASVTLTLPPLPEQTAIATVLSDMDLELAALEQRRDKTRALKQGMMQELLTGRTRLL
jgi:type I restriction enzyme, S subunit